MKTQKIILIALMLTGMLISSLNAQNTKNVKTLYANAELEHLKYQKQQLQVSLSEFVNFKDTNEPGEANEITDTYGLKALENEIRFHPSPDKNLTVTHTVELSMDTLLSELYPVVKFKPVDYVEQ